MHDGERASPFVDQHRIQKITRNAMTTPGALMAAEIAEQPDALSRLLRDGRTEAERARAAVAKFAPRFVLLAARGTSDHAALYAKYLAEVELNLPAGLASASSFTVYGSRPQ